jgi:hypothetical protein
VKCDHRRYLLDPRKLSVDTSELNYWRSDVGNLGMGMLISLPLSIVPANLEQNLPIIELVNDNKDCRWSSSELHSCMEIVYPRELNFCRTAVDHTYGGSAA